MLAAPEPNHPSLIHIFSCLLGHWMQEGCVPEVVSTLKVTAALVWEAEGGAAGSGWGEGPPVVLPERRALLELPSVGTFAPQEVE